MKERQKEKQSDFEVRCQRDLWIRLIHNTERDTSRFLETQNRQADTKEMQRHEDIQLNKEEDEYNRAQAVHSNKDQQSFLYLPQPSAFPDGDVQKLLAGRLSAPAPTCLGHDQESCPCLFLPMIPCNTAYVWHFQNSPKNVSLHPSSSFIPTTPNNTVWHVQNPPKNTPVFLSFFNLTTPNSSTVRPSLVRRGEESWLTGASIHTPKSAKARRWHRQKNNKRLPIHGRGSATLYQQRQNKGRPVEHSDCVYFQGGTMPLRGGGKDWCGTWGPLRKNSTSFWFTVSLRKQ